MKKLYLHLVGTVLVSVLLTSAISAQTTNTAIRSGNWSNPLTWDVNGIPAALTTNAKINISAGITVTVDVNEHLEGTSEINVGAGASLVFHNSGQIANQGTLFSGNNILLDHQAIAGTPAGFPRINLLSNTSTVNASALTTAGGNYDGIFNNTNSIAGFSKMVGILGDQCFNTNTGRRLGTTNCGTALGMTVAGPGTLTPTGTLPVTLVDFTATLVNGVVNLSWSTDVEINSASFTIQRSSTGNNFQPIGSVAARGYSTTQANYSFVDQSPASGVNYYRLVMVDKDGKFAYSSVRIVRGSVVKGVTIFPNPATSNINISLGNDAGATVSIRLTNQFGQLLQQQKVSHAAGTIVSLPVSTYPEGLYFVQVSDDSGFKQSTKVLITR